MLSPGIDSPENLEIAKGVCYRTLLLLLFSVGHPRDQEVGYLNSKLFAGQCRRTTTSANWQV